MKPRSIAIILSLAFTISLAAQETEQPLRPDPKVASNAVVANRIPKFSDTTGINFTESVIYEKTDSYGEKRVGIGTDDPKAQLHIYGPATSDVFAGIGVDPSSSTGAFTIGYSGFSFGRASAFFNVRPDPAAVAPNPSLRFLTGNVQHMIITNTGNIGIGTLTPGYKLHVNGTARFEGDVTGTRITAHYQDVAEWVPSNDDLPAGTVVVLDANIGNGVMASSRAYDTTVAGVVSEQPGILLGEGSPDKEMVATTGRVRVKVDASRGAIAVGDLLVTSDNPGYAMRSTPIEVGGALLHRPGTIVGKALQPLASGEGAILVLLSLQ